MHVTLMIVTFDEKMGSSKLINLSYLMCIIILYNICNGAQKMTNFVNIILCVTAIGHATLVTFPIYSWLHCQYNTSGNNIHLINLLVNSSKLTRLFIYSICIAHYLKINMLQCA